MVHRLKYGGFTRLGVLAAEMIDREIERSADLLVPVPLGPGRFRVRGYNQSAYIARALGERWAVPAAEDLLVRRRETRSQTRLAPAERAANVRGAFEALRGPRDNAPTSGPPRTIGIVDDVFTTGATIVEAATALRDKGWNSVVGITFARARTFADVVSLGK